MSSYIPRSHQMSSRVLQYARLHARTHREVLGIAEGAGLDEVERLDEARVVVLPLVALASRQAGTSSASMPNTNMFSLPVSCAHTHQDTTVKKVH